jgi:spermidine synthase
VNTSPRTPLLGPRAAEALVFITSAAVLVLEILGMRLVAPYVGISLETSTAVIGVALTAIAAGAWWGGRLADSVPPERVLGPLVLAGGLCVMLVLPLVRWAGELLRGGSAGAVLLLAALVLFVPATLLSAVTPMVIKLQLASLDETGAVVGRLSAIGTVGAIVATFATGFLLVAAAPSSIILLTTGALLVLVGAVLSLHRRRRVTVAAAAGAALVIGATGAYVAPQRCDVETAYHCARIEADPDRPSGRTLRLDTLRHSYVDLEDPTHLEFEYTRFLASAVDAAWPAGAAVRALHVGGGGLTLPRYLASERPGSDNLVLEIDGGVVDLVRAELGPSTGPLLHVDVGDARTGVHDQPSRSRDLVVGDAFGGLSVPWHLATTEFLEEVERVLTDDGLYAANVIDYGGRAFLRAELRTVAGVFDHVAVLTEAGSIAGAEGDNFVVLASNRPLPMREIEKAAQGRVNAVDVLPDRAAVLAYAGPGRLLTDDWAPVDQLLGGG